MSADWACDGGYACLAVEHIEGCYTGEGDPAAARGLYVAALRTENEALKAEVKRVDAIARERDDFLFEIGKVLERHDDRLHSLAGEAE